MVWQAIGYYMVMYLASMSAVPISLYESAKDVYKRQTEQEVKDMSSQLMDIVAAFGGMQSKDPADSEVQAQVKNCLLYTSRCV